MHFRKFAASLTAVLAGFVGLAQAQSIRSPIQCPANIDCVITNYRHTTTVSNVPGNFQGLPRSGFGHEGTDFSANAGTEQIKRIPVVAAASGAVVALRTGLSPRVPCSPPKDCPPLEDAYGNYVVLRHQVPGTNDTFLTLYAHLQKDTVRVSLGDAVTCGDVLASIGNTGLSSSYHLHFDVRLGSAGLSTTELESATARRNTIDPFGCKHSSCKAAPSLWTMHSDNGLPGSQCPTAEGPQPEKPEPGDPEDSCNGVPTNRWVCNEVHTGLIRCIDKQIQYRACTTGCSKAGPMADDNCIASEPEKAISCNTSGANCLVNEEAALEPNTSSSQKRSGTAAGCTVTNKRVGSSYFGMGSAIVLWLLSVSFRRRRRISG